MTFDLDIWRAASLATVQITFQCQGHRSPFQVIGGKCCWSEICDIEWRLSS